MGGAGMRDEEGADCSPGAFALLLQAARAYITDLERSELNMSRHGPAGLPGFLCSARSAWEETINPRGEDEEKTVDL